MTTPTETYGRVKRTYRAPDWVHRPLGLVTDAQPATTFGADALGVAMDMFTNNAARMGWGTPSLTEGTEYNLVRLSFDYWLLISLYCNHWITRKIVEGPAKDMIRAWPKMTSEISPADLSRLDRAIHTTATKQRMLEGLKWGRLFGGAGALIVVDGHEKILDEPLDLDEVKPHSYRGLIPFDRWVGVSPEGEMCADINRPIDFNLPEHYRVTDVDGRSFTVHASRILRFCGPDVPRPESDARQHWGISVIEPVYEEIRKRDNMSWTILSLTFRASILGLTLPDLAPMMTGLGATARAQQDFYNRMTAINEMVSNNGMILMGKDSSLHQTAASFPGVADVYQQFQLDISGASGYPVSRLFGRTISGLPQSNDADERMYEERIQQDQDAELRPQLDKLLPVVAMSEWGEVPDDLFTYTFPSIRVLTEEEKADLAQKSSAVVISAFSGGLIDKPQSLRELKQMSDITGIFTNITDDDIENAQKEMDQAKQIRELMGAAGMAGAMGGPEGGGPEGGGEPGAENPVSEASSSAEGMLKQAAKPAQKQAEKKPAPEKKETPELKKQKAADEMSTPRWRSKVCKDAIVAYEYTFQSIPVAVEYPAGVQRTLRNPAGKVVYDRTMLFDYGFIPNTVGRDGDEIDVIVGNDDTADKVYVVDMIDLGPDVEAREDEDKVCIGFATADEARDAFLTMYPESFFGGMAEFQVGEFVANWLGEPGVPAKATDDSAAAKKAWETRRHGGKHDTPAAQSGKHGGAAAAMPATKKKGLQLHHEGSGKIAKMVAASANRKSWPAHLQNVYVAPAWKGLKLNPDPKSALWITGLDAKGKTQYIYNPKFKATQAEKKFARTKKLIAQLPKIRQQNLANMKSDPEHASCMRLIAEMGLRPGSDTDTNAAKKAYGATTLEGRHVVQNGGEVRLQFTGKKGVDINLPVTDKQIAADLLNRAKAEGKGGRLFEVTDKSMLKYSHSLGSGHFKTKDFRTAVANQVALREVAQMTAPKTEKEYKKSLKTVATVVAEKLGNTPTIALQSYISPTVFADWQAGIE